MSFLLRAVFWTAVVVVFVPGASHGTGPAAGLPTLESLKADAILHPRARPDGVERTRLASAIERSRTELPGPEVPAPAREPMSCPSFSPGGSPWFAGFFFARRTPS